LITELETFGLHVMVNDAVATADQAARYGVTFTDDAEITDLDLMVVAVAHDEYRDNPALLARLKDDGILCDMRGIYREAALPETLGYWSL
jgi:UDP-N-acetyl-D-galactosamine dehydrogenase